jgi:hypothetical protein
MTHTNNASIRCSTVRFAAKVEDSPEDVHFVFTPAEWSILTEFVTFATELRAAALLNRRRTTGFRIAMEGDRSFSDATRPETAELATYLRPFLLEGERTAFAKTAKLVAKATAHSQIREILAGQRRIFAGKTAQRFYALRVNGQDVNSEPAFRKWINGYLFHRDPEKRASLAHLEGTTMEIARGEFVDMLVDKAVAVIQLAEFVTRIQTAEAAPGAKDN